jgi:AcrR family transcriptional regulator
MRKVDNRIWDAAIRLFASKGFAATGIREIAEEAGLSVSAMYYYVNNKEELLVQIMRDTQERFVAAGRVVTEQLPEPAAALAGLAELHVMVHAHTPLEARVVDTELRALSEEHLKEMVELRDQYDDLWTDVLVRGSDDGVFTFRSPHTTRLALLEMCNGVSAWFSPDGPLTIAEVADEFADLALALVRASQDGTPLTVRDLDLPNPDWFSSLMINTTERHGPEAEVAVTKP